MYFYLFDNICVVILHYWFISFQLLVVLELVSDAIFIFFLSLPNTHTLDLFSNFEADVTNIHKGPH